MTKGWLQYLGVPLAGMAVYGAAAWSRQVREAAPDDCCRPNAPSSAGPTLGPPVGAPLDAAPGERPPATPSPPLADRTSTGRGRWLHPTIRLVGVNDDVVRPYAAVDFDLLGGFDYGPQRPWDLVAERRSASRERRPEVPASIRALSGRRVVIEGFMMPMDYDRSGVGEFILNGSYDMCAFGVPSRLNDWVLVRMKEGRRTRFAGHFPIWVYGRLDVGERRRGDQVDSLYRLEADFIGVPEGMIGG
jgi:hypothetical protein